MSKNARTLIGVLAVAWVVGFSLSADAAIIRGRFTAALKGGDLTDPDNNGDPENNVNYNATFSSSEEAGFGGAEGAFNVFDNQVGGGNAKWCCGDQNNFPTNPISIDATFPVGRILTHFTITSGNDTPERDPRVWQIQGSNDGTNFTPIFVQNNPAAGLWTERDQVIEFDEGVDFPVQSTPYTTFRFITTATGLTMGARFQLAEIEYFDTPVPEPSAALLAALGGLSLVARGRR